MKCIAESGRSICSFKVLIHLSKKCDVSKKKCDISKVYSSEKRDIIKQVLRHVAVEVKLETMTDQQTDRQ